MVRFFTSGVLVLALSLTNAQAQRATQADILERDAERLAAMWDGLYDNANQVNFQERFDLPVEGWHARQMKIFKRVDLPAFGKTVTYTENFLGEPPEALYRQRIYHHWPDHETGEVVTDIYSFRGDDAEKAAGGHLDLSKLEGFSPDNMDMIPRGCEVRWKAVGDHFVGVQTAETCLYTPVGFSEQVRVGDHITLTADIMTTETEIRAEDGKLLSGNALGVPQVSRKARTFTCMVLARRFGVDESLQRFDGIKTYDQGGEFFVITEHTPPIELHVRLLKIIPPAGPSRHTLIMVLSEQNELFPTAMAFVEPNAPRVAISIAGVEANCTADDSMEQARF